ncbi:MAG: hypothetical protein NTU66_04365 [Elusimicrobia bacterium]|nr:hypothetical protein [Elusimicrobiota bacterium]
MNNGIINKIILVGVLLAIASGCEHNPLGKLIDPTTSNTTNASSGTWVIFGDELRTNGAIQFLTTAEGQSLDFTCTDRPYAGMKCMKYSWDGSAVTPYDTGVKETDWVGFMLIAAPTIAQHDTFTKDLTAAGYTKISFYVRGDLSKNVYLRLESNNGTYQTPSGNNAWINNTTDRKITSDWQHFEFTLSGSVTTVKDLVRIVLRYDEDGDPDIANTGTSNGGTVFLDNIEYLR